jgi:thioredoxin reductase (NADPH)
MTTHHTKVLIIGSGAAGCTAAIYAARAGLEPMLVRGMQPGGQLTITTDVENYPGFAEAVQGPWLMEQMEQQAINVGTRVINDVVTSADLSKRPFNISCDSGDTFIAETLIIATGASARWLGIEGEAEFQNYGVSACATCDGFFYRNKEVVVIGGGNSAVEEALFLANIASKVTLIHRRDSLKAEKIAQDRLFKHPKVSVVWNSAPIAFLGDDEPRSLTGVKVRNTIDGSESIVSTHGAFVAIGHEPNTDLFKGQLEVDEFNYLITKPDSTATSIKGVYAAGDVQDRIYRQAITAAGTGCMAALEAERFLSHHES